MLRTIKLFASSLLCLALANCAIYTESAREFDPSTLTNDPNWIAVENVSYIEQQENEDCGEAIHLVLAGTQFSLPWFAGTVTAGYPSFLTLAWEPFQDETVDPLSDASALHATTCTWVIGMSQTGDLYNAGDYDTSDTNPSILEEALDPWKYRNWYAPGYELTAYSDPAQDALLWDNPEVFVNRWGFLDLCARNSDAPERVIFTFSEHGAPTVAQWEADLMAALDRLALKMPGVREVFLQPTAGTPGHGPSCTHPVDEADCRAENSLEPGVVCDDPSTYATVKNNHLNMWQAAQNVLERGHPAFELRAGYDLDVEDCRQYDDSVGHFDGDLKVWNDVVGDATVRQPLALKMADFYRNGGLLEAEDMTSTSAPVSNIGTGFSDTSYRRFYEKGDQATYLVRRDDLTNSQAQFRIVLRVKERTVNPPVCIVAPSFEIFDANPGSGDPVLATVTVPCSLLQAWNETKAADAGNAFLLDFDAAGTMALAVRLATDQPVELDYIRLLDQTPLPPLRVATP